MSISIMAVSFDARDAAELANFSAQAGGHEVWERHSSWMAPRFWDRESNEVVTCSASYLVRSAGKNILIDTGSGNGKECPYFPLSSHLDTPYIQDLGSHGSETRRR